MMGMGKTMKTPAPTSTAVSNCSQGGFGVLMADHNVGEGGKRGSAHHHAYEQLLVEWFAGAYDVWEQGRQGHSKHQHPPSTAASFCLQGGSGATGHITPPPPITASTTPGQ